MNPAMRIPSQPLEHDTVEHYAWEVKNMMVVCIRQTRFKHTIFRDKIVWSTRLRDYFDTLLRSEVLESHEKLIVATLAESLLLLATRVAKGTAETIQDGIQYLKRTCEAFKAMLAADYHMRVPSQLGTAFEAWGLADLEFERGIVEDHFECDDCGHKQIK